MFIRFVQFSSIVVIKSILGIFVNHIFFEPIIICLRQWLNWQMLDRASPEWRHHVCIFTGGVLSSAGSALSLETLLDILLVLYDECQSPALRREKRITEFVDFGKIVDLLYMYMCLLNSLSKYINMSRLASMA